MYESSALDAISITALFFISVLLTAGAVEAGWWLGLRRKRMGAEAEAPAGATVGAVLGLLALTLAFTFGMAADRYNTRKEMVVKDANAIGTTYLRTSLLPEPLGSDLRQSLREYVDARLIAALQPEQFAAQMERIQELQDTLWRQAAALGAREPAQITVGLFLQSLNEMIDIQGERLQALRNRLPTSIWAFLFVTAIVGMLSLGYHAALSGTRRSLAAFALVLALSSVILVIADLDRTQEGFLRVSQQAMVDLQQSMKAGR